MKIYADNAATTKMSQRAIQAMLPYMSEIYGNPSVFIRKGREPQKLWLTPEGGSQDFWGRRKTRSCLLPEAGNRRIRQSSQPPVWEKEQEKNIIYPQGLNTMRFYIHWTD